MALDPSVIFKQRMLDETQLGAAQAQGQMNENRLAPLRMQAAQQQVASGDLKMKADQLDMDIKKNALALQILGGATDQDTYSRSLSTAGQYGIDLSSFPQQYDPKFVQQMSMSALDADDRMKMAQNDIMNQMRQERLDLDQQRLSDTESYRDVQNKLAEARLTGFYSPEDAAPTLGGMNPLQQIPDDPTQRLPNETLPAYQARVRSMIASGGGTQGALLDRFIKEPDVVSAMSGMERAKGLGKASAEIDTVAEVERQKARGAPMPEAAVEEIADIEFIAGQLGGVNADLNAIRGAITGGNLTLGPVENKISAAKNWASMSDPNSRNFGTMMATLQKQRNASLLLAKGVQTEGDAVRAWSELFDSFNDGAFVARRLGEIEEMNKRNAALATKKANTIKANYGRPTSGGQAYSPAPSVNMEQTNSSTAIDYSEYFQ